MDDTTTAVLQEILAHLKRGETLLSGIEAELRAVTYLEPSRAFRLQVWFLFSILAMRVGRDDLYGGSGSKSILMCSVIGIGLRYARGTWIFTFEHSGLLRPNASVVSQGPFATFAVFFMISIPIYPLGGAPTDGAFTFELLLFVPLAIAFHVNTWSTSLAPTTSLAFLSSSKPRAGRSTRRRLTNVVAVGSLVVFLASIIPPTYYMSHHRITLMAYLREGFATLTTVEAQGGTDTDALLALLPVLEAVSAGAARLMYFYRMLVAVYLTWGFIWLLVYIPTSVRLLATLRERRIRLRRSLKSLKVIEELVTHEDLEAEAAAATQLPALLLPVAQHRLRARSPPLSPQALKRTSRSMFDFRSNISPNISPSLNFSSSSPPPPFSSPSLSSSGGGRDVEVAIELAEMFENPAPSSISTTANSSPPNPSLFSHDSAQKPPPKSSPSPGTGSSSTGKVIQARLFAERILDEFGLGGHDSGARGGEKSVGEVRGVGDGTKDRGAEVRVTLERTNKLLATMGIQFIVTNCMATSSVAFCIVLLASNTLSPHSIQTTFVSWTGWTFAGPALARSLLFAILSFSSAPTTAHGPRPTTPTFNPDYSPPTLSSHARAALSSPPPPPPSTTKAPRGRLESRLSAVSGESGRTEEEDENGRFGLGVGGTAGAQRWVPSAWAMERRKTLEGVGGEV